MTSQFDLTGTVVQLNPPISGRISRSTSFRVVKTLTLILIVPAVLIAIGVLRFSMAVAGSLASGIAGKPRHSHDVDSRDGYLADVLAHLTAMKIGSTGDTLVTHLRIRDAAGQLFALRIEGDVRSGAFACGDLVTVHVRVLEGAYVVTGGSNHTTKEVLRIAR